jgi:hypothetical protein
MLVCWLVISGMVLSTIFSNFKDTKTQAGTIHYVQLVGNTDLCLWLKENKYSIIFYSILFYTSNAVVKGPFDMCRPCLLLVAQF